MTQNRQKDEESARVFVKDCSGRWATESGGVLGKRLDKGVMLWVKSVNGVKVLDMGDGMGGGSHRKMIRSEIWG